MFMYRLNGFVFSGDKQLKVDGWSFVFAIIPTSNHAATFELVFPEYRHVKLKWWVGVENVKKTEIASTFQNLKNDSLLVTYNFQKTPYSRANVDLKFSRNSFVDGNPPLIKKLSFNPVGNNGIDELAIMGDIYDIHAELNRDETITLALPLDFEYVQGRDSVFVAHYIESENRWFEEPIDSVVNNIAYFKASSFSPRSLLRKGCKIINKVAETVACPACASVALFDEDVENAMESIASTWTSVQMTLIDGSAVDFVQNLIVDFECFNFKDAGGQFVNLWNDISDLLAQSSDWDVDQGQLSQKVNSDANLIVALTEKRDTGLNYFAIPLENVCESISNANKVTTGVALDCSTETIDAWKATILNLDALLADAILAQVNQDPDESRRYTFVMDDDEMYINDNVSRQKMKYRDVLKTNGGLLEDAAWVVSGLKSCYGATNVSGKILSKWEVVAKDLQNYSLTEACSDFFTQIGAKEAFNQLNQTFTCSNFLSDILSTISFKDDHVDKLLMMSDIMMRVSLLSWIDKTMFRKYSAVAYKSIADGTAAWLELASPLMIKNNVVTKAYASIALYEFINEGKTTYFDEMNIGLNYHYGENGGYSEGSGYSQFIWDDVTYVMAAMKDAYQSKKSTKFSLNDKFLKSPDYMFEFSRTVGDYGRIPVEVDDGCTYNPDYRVWAKLKDDSKYLAWSEENPLRGEEEKINVFVPFGFTDEELSPKDSEVVTEHENKNLWGAFKDGLGLITAVSADGDTVSLSMIAENGKLWSRGQSHDQQDNLSITLASKKNGFLIQDRGYSGFDKRNSSDGFHRYFDHNVLTMGTGCDKDNPSLDCINKSCVPDNEMISTSGIRDRLYDLSGDISGLEWTVISILISESEKEKESLAVEGGNEAFKIDSVENFKDGVVGYTAAMRFNEIKQSSNNLSIPNQINHYCPLKNRVDRLEPA